MGSNNIFEGMKDVVGDASLFVKCLGNPYRLSILCYLIDGEKNVSQISEHVDSRRTYISQHLIRLRLSGMVDFKRRGNFVYYKIRNDLARDIIQILYSHHCVSNK